MEFTKSVDAEKKRKKKKKRKKHANGSMLKGEKDSSLQNLGMVCFFKPN